MRAHQSWRLRRSMLGPGSVSIAAHIVVATALIAFPIARHLSSPRTRSISVDLVSPSPPSELRLLSSTQEPLPSQTLPTELRTPPTAPLPVSPQLTKQAVEPADGMIAATNLLAGDILHDPANRQVRETLPKLDRYERITQLCNIEALEQVRLSGADGLADVVVPSAIGDTTIADTLMKAPQGAYRADREWYEIAFECVAGADLESVSAFKFKLGAAIPHDEWDSHNLTAEEFEDD